MKNDQKVERGRKVVQKKKYYWMLGGQDPENESNFFQLTSGKTAAAAAAAATFTPAITHANVSSSSNRKTVGLVSSSRSGTY